MTGLLSSFGSSRQYRDEARELTPTKQGRCDRDIDDARDKVRLAERLQWDVASNVALRSRGKYGPERGGDPSHHPVG